LILKTDPKPPQIQTDNDYTQTSHSRSNLKQRNPSTDAGKRVTDDERERERYDEWAGGSILTWMR
jgi:hypothetical protein